MNDEAPDKTSLIQHKNTHKTTAWLSFLTLLTLSSLGYTVYISKQLSIQTKRETTLLAAHINTLKQDQASAQEQRQTEQTTQQTAEQNIHVALDKLNYQMQSAITPSSDVSNHWLLLKARYAIELAQLNAYWSSDRLTTIALLKQADGFLAQHQDPQLFTVRQTLAHEISEQETIPTHDKAGLLSQLDALQQQIATQPFKQTSRAPISPAPTPTEPVSWQARIHASFGLLKQFFVVRYHPDPLQPLLTPAYKALQRETIRLNLQEAQWAILQQNTVVYQLALKQASRNIRRAFGKNNTCTQPMIQQLQQLAAAPIQEAKIIPDASLVNLNQVIDAEASSALPVGANKP